MEGFVSRNEIEGALRKSDERKAVDLDRIPIDVWKLFGPRHSDWLFWLFNEGLKSGMMPNE